MTEFVVITGLSGAGRSTAADVLEDQGWFVIDNMPVLLMPKVAELATQPASATGAQLFCGFTALSAVGDAPNGGYSGISDPVVVGTDWYAFNQVAATQTGTKNTML